MTLPAPRRPPGERSRIANLLLKLAGSLVALALCREGLTSTHRPQAVASGQMTPDEAAALQRKLNRLLDARRFAEALPLAQRILEEFPDNPIFIRRVAELHTELGQLEPSTVLWERFMKVAPSPADASPALGEAYRRLGRMEASVDAFRRASELEPRNGELKFHLGRGLEWAKRYPEAREVYQTICREHPGHTDATLGLARMECFIGQPRIALQHANEVLARSPLNVDALLAQGMALRQLDRPDEARAALLKGLERSPGYTDFMLVLAGLAISQNRPDEAAAWYDRYLALEPGDLDIRRRRAALRLPKGTP